MSPARPALAAVGALLLAVGAACDRIGERSGAERSGAEEDVEPRVFLREPDPGDGPGRLTLHLLVPPGAESEQVRRTLERHMESAAEEDPTLIAVRAIAYVIAPSDEREAGLVPVGWGERALPPGWTGADRRERSFRNDIHIGAPPEWAEATGSDTTQRRD